MDIKLSKVEVTLPNGRRLFRIKSLEIPFGSKVLISGASGKGKTTLLHLIAGLFIPSEGSVFVGEFRYNSLTDEERSELRRQHFGMVFQKLNLLDHLTTAENVELGLGAPPRGESINQAVERVLKVVGIDRFAHERTANLSLGEQQRAAIARMLISQPKIILADEPTSSLDEANAAKVLAALMLAAENKTLVVVSHDSRIRQQFKTHIDFSEYVEP